MSFPPVAVLDMTDPGLRIEPNPDWAHCARCVFRSPCFAANLGGDLERALADRFRERLPDP